MRKEKLEFIERSLDELKTVKFEITNPNKRFITSIPYLFTLNNGRVIPREKMFKNGLDGSAVTIAPFIKELNEFLIVIEPRVFTKLGVSASFPAGYIEKDETCEEAAIRELKEETGYVSKEMIHLDSYYQDEGISSAFNHSFLALDCEKQYDQDLDTNEIIRYTTFTYDELLEIEKMGLISGANTKLMLCRIKNYL